MERPSLALRALLLVVAGAAVVAASGAFGGTKPSSRNLRVKPIEVVAHPIASFDKADPKKTRFGRLTWRGGLVLTSPSSNFGGWSGLALGPSGKSFLAVSDAGAWMSGQISYDAGGEPTGMRSVRIGPLEALSGGPLKRSRDRDAEGLTLLKGTPEKGEVLVSFERNHRIGRFGIGAKGLFQPLGYLDLPAGIKKRLHSNSGLEAISVLRGGPNEGALVAFAESLHDRDGDHVGWIWVKGRPEAFYLTNPGDFSVTDAAALPDGGLIVLERRFRWSEGVKARLRLIKHDELRPGAHLKGETLLDADMGQEIDNMEGVAVHTGRGGEALVTLISDDNFNKVLQRTLLLQFALDGADLASSGTR